MSAEERFLEAIEGDEEEDKIVGPYYPGILVDHEFYDNPDFSTWSFVASNQFLVCHLATGV